MARLPTALTTALRTLQPVRLPRHPAIRRASTFQQQPAPPRLPAEQQAEFERLQRAAAARQPLEPAPPPSSPLSTSRHSTTRSSEASPAAQEPKPKEGEVWRGAPPEFEGDTNPKTGEVGGPKNEPLRWGSAGDWSYNGRVTDF